MRVFFASAVILCPVLLTAGQSHGYLRKVGPAPLRFAETLPPPPLVNEAILALDDPAPEVDESPEVVDVPPDEPPAVDPPPEVPDEPAEVDVSPPVNPEPEPANDEVVPLFPEIPQATLAPPTNEPQLLNEITAILGSGRSRGGGPDARVPGEVPTSHGGVRPAMVVPLNVFTPPEPVAQPNASGAVYRRN